MTIEQLRLIHPRFIYRSVEVKQTDASIEFVYEFILEPDIHFHPTVAIPRHGHILPEEVVTAWAFSLGMVELISYWKAAIPKEIVIEAGSCSEEQLRFWRDLMIHGLGEFYYQNGIDFTAPDFFSLHVLDAKPRPLEQLPAYDEPEGDLVLASGGKDTAVTLGILKNSDRTIQTTVLNPTQSSLDIVAAAGFKDPIIVKRVMDPQLGTLNARGYLNGHTPFSAYLAFLGTFVATLYGYGHVIVSNEQSANEGNVVYRGMEINHQYSKSYRFEQLFRKYVSEYLGNTASYFSFLRPVNDLQIGKLFSGFPEFFTLFRSCNVKSRENAWCGTCAKCAFTYLILSPFLSREQLIASFGGDLFQTPEIIEHIKAEIGLTPVKPFECVGTRDEARLALLLVIKRYLREGQEVPEALLLLKSELHISEETEAELTKRLLNTWADTYNLPPEYLAVLKHAWDESFT